MDQYLAIVQAHMSSTRLPGKVMMELCSKPVIWHVTERLKLSRKLKRTVVATSLDSNDDGLCEYLHESGIECFRGSEEDVLDRFYRTSVNYPSRAVVRITSDNPLIDPWVLDETIAFFEKERLDYVRTEGFPIGIGAEVFKTALLKKTFEQARTAYEREHVTPAMAAGEENQGVYRCRDALETIRLTLDTKEDFAFIERIYKNFFKEKHDFFLEDIVGYLRQKPEPVSTDCGIAQEGR